MSKKVLKLAGRRPMLLALIIMVTLALGIVFSGWLTPTRSKAQEGGGGGGSNNENTNCVATTNAWSGTCPTIITNSSVSQSTIYDPWDTAPTMPTNIVAPVYSPTNIFTQLITYDSTNCTTVTNTENVTYSVSGVMWTNFSCPYTNFPSLLTNSFSAQPYVIVTSSDANLCPSPGLVYIGGDTANSDTASSSATPADTGSSFVMWNPYGIIHKCVNTSPSKKPGVGRTDVGVGEQVNLSINNLPANTTVQWDCGGVGSIDNPSQPTCVWTAPDSTGLDPNAPFNPINGSTAPTKACTVQATYTISGDVKTPLVSFTIYRPTSVNMKRAYPLHTINTCFIGEKNQIYLGPDNVNFSAVTIKEEAVNPIYGTPIEIIGTGCYQGQNPHGTSVSISMTSTVVADLGTEADVSFIDDVEFNPASFLGSGYGSQMGEGYAEGDIPNDWQCGGSSSAWQCNFYTSVEKGSSTAVSGSSGVYQLHAEKCGATYDCKSSDSTQTSP